mmetsp:Transcript_65586/g.165256  ORF Transcript_65586/g.165256 Transcript_65586/m.165256 type:complete len:243 (+) Transcript_65586:1097-1825(+)
MPGLLERLVEDLEEDIREVAIHLRELFEETACLLRVLLRLVVVPVDDYVQAGANCCVDNFGDHRLLHIHSFKIATASDAHRSTDESDVPILLEPINHVRRPVLAAPLRPEQRHASQTNRVAVRVDQLSAPDAQLPMLRNNRAGGWYKVGGNRCAIIADGAQDLARPRLLVLRRVVRVDSGRAIGLATGPELVLYEALVPLCSAAPRGPAIVDRAGAAWLAGISGDEEEEHLKERGTEEDHAY